MSWYVYAIFENENSDPFYIGKGSGYRTTATLNCNTASFLKERKINSIRESGNEPIVKVLETFANEDEALIFERTLISFYGKKIDGTGILTNLADGGEVSNTGWTPSDETRKLWSKQRRGHTQTKEHIKKRVQKNKGKKRSVDQKRNSQIGAIRRRADELLPIVEEIEKTLPYYHGMYKDISRRLGVDSDRVSRIYKNLDLYKEALYGK